MNIPPSLREPRPGRRDRPLEIYAMQAGPAGLEVPVHWHDHAEILLMQAGELALTVEGEPRTGRPGDVFYLNPRALHGMRSPGPECRYLAFVFPLPWLGFAQADEAEDYLRPLAEGSARVATQLPPDSAAAAGVLLNQAAAWAKSEAPGGWLGVKGCLLQLFARLYADGQIKSRPAETALADTLRAIAKYLEKNPRGGIHHVAFNSNDIIADLAKAKDAGVILLNETPKIGAHSKKIAFLHPKSTFGVLTEICQD